MKIICNKIFGTDKKGFFINRILINNADNVEISFRLVFNENKSGICEDNIYCCGILFRSLKNNYEYFSITHVSKLRKNIRANKTSLNLDVELTALRDSNLRKIFEQFKIKSKIMNISIHLFE